MLPYALDKEAKQVVGTFLFGQDEDVNDYDTITKK